MKGNADLKRALIQNVDGRWEMFSGGRGVVAASVFYKYFDKPIERVVIAAAQPDRHVPERRHAPGTSASSSRRARQFGEHFFFNANYTFVDSKITLLPEQRDGADLARAAAGRPVEEPVQPDRRSSRCSGFSTRRAVQLLRRPHLGRRRQRGAGHHRAGARLARPGVRAADSRPRHPARRSRT